MILSVVGDTDKRPIMYTLLKVCQYLGDVLLVTNDRHYARLIEEPEEDVEIIAGHFQDIFIVVTDKTPDETSQAVGYVPEDYEFIIYDNKVDVSGDAIIYVAGCEMSEAEYSALGYLEEEDYITINFGFGKKNVIPYTGKMFMNCELTEGKHVLVPIDNKISTDVVRILSPLVNIPEKTLMKAVMNNKK